MSWFSRSRGRRSAPRVALALSASVVPLVEDLERRTLLSVPNGPFAVTATATGASSVGVQFYDNSTDETGFVVERSPAAAGPFTAVGNLGPAAGTGPRTFADDSVPTGGNYYYRVKAVGTSGDSSYGGPAPVVVAGAGSGIVGTPPVIAVPPASSPGGVPNGPFGMTAVAAGGAVNLQFVDNSNNETGFVVERSVSPGGAYAAVATLPASAGTRQTVSYADTATVPGTTYSYRAYAINGAPRSGFAGPVTVTTSGGAPVVPVIPVTPVTSVIPVTPVLPSGPANPGGTPNGPFALTAAAASATSVNLSFVDNSDNETGFVVERATGGGTFTAVGIVGPSAGTHATVTFTDVTATAGATYVYRAYAVNGSLPSSAAGAVSTTTPAGPTTTPPATGGTLLDGGSSPATPANPGGAPNGPFALSVTAVNSMTVRVSFVDNADNETGFAVERSSSPSGPFVLWGTLPPSTGIRQTVTCYDGAALASSSYYYRVYAVNGGYTSSATEPAGATTPQAGSLSGGTLTLGSSNSVTLNATSAGAANPITIPITVDLNTGGATGGATPIGSGGTLVLGTTAATTTATGVYLLWGTSSIPTTGTLTIGLPPFTGTGLTIGASNGLTGVLSLGSGGVLSLSGTAPLP